MSGNNEGSKARVLTAALSLGLLVALIAGAILVNDAQANFIVQPPKEIDVYLLSPSNREYNAADVLLEFYAAVPAGSKVLSVRYWLDGKLRGEDAGDDLPKTYSVMLSGLPDGQHSVKAEMTVHYVAISYFVINFVDISSKSE